LQQELSSILYTGLTQFCRHVYGLDTKFTGRSLSVVKHRLSLSFIALFFIKRMGIRGGLVVVVREVLCVLQLFPRRYRAWGVRFKIHLHLVPTLRMSRAGNPVGFYVFLGWTTKNLPLHFTSNMVILEFNSQSGTRRKF
jgi:hypothetical protein